MNICHLSGGRARGALGIITAALLGGLAAPHRVSAAAAPAFAFPTGRLTYKISSPTMTGTTLVSWIEGGRKFRQDMTGSITAEKRRTKITGWTISDGVHMYSHSSQLGKKVMRMKVPDQAKRLSGGLPLIAVAKNTGKLVGRGTVLGKPCEIREIGRGKLWVWNGLPLKAEMDVGQGRKMTTTATRVETSVKLSPSLFKVPPGYKVEDYRPPQQPGGRK
jgi:outer membrane lipoprotein-sorting protein